MKKHIIIKSLAFILLAGAVFIVLSFMLHRTPFRYSIGTTEYLKNSGTQVMVSKQNCINNHNYYTVRDNSDNQIEVAEEEITNIQPPEKSDFDNNSEFNFNNPHKNQDTAIGYTDAGLPIFKRKTKN